MRILAGPLTGREDGGPTDPASPGSSFSTSRTPPFTPTPIVGGAFVDIFSCREFDHEVVLGVFDEFFGSHRVRELETQTRGRHWGADIRKEQLAWSGRRDD